jgi:ATP-dependent DNA ligase
MYARGIEEVPGSHWCTAPSFEDAGALWAVVERDELEGVVAKPLGGRYRPGAREGKTRAPARNP